MKARLLPVYFAGANERERGEFNEQLSRLRKIYGEVADFLDPILAGDPAPDADAVLFPQLIGSAFREKDQLKTLVSLPMIVLTSRFGTVEMWDWEIVTYLRDEGFNVFTPYNIELAKVVLRTIAAKTRLRSGGKFLMLQDTPGEGMQANIFKRFYWWENECTERMQKTFGIQMIYRSWKETAERAKTISDDEARPLWLEWKVNQEGVSEANALRAVKLYMAVKEVINEVGGVEGVGCNCLNESFLCDTTPCLAWNMIFERDHLIWACEGDTLTMLSTFILYRSLEAPIMMTNLYPFLVGMAALAHEKIDRFPNIPDPDNHLLGVHCGYFGFAPRCFCSEWTMRPKVLEIVDPNAIVIDCRFPKGAVTIAKIYPNFKKMSVIEAELVDYVQYPGSDCRNGALIRCRNGHEIMEELSSHHALIIVGKKTTELKQIAKVFGMEAVIL